MAGGDALLVRDINRDGVINNGRQLFGAGTLLADGSRADDGYSAMAALDLNHDRKLTAADVHFGELKLWMDANHDGKTDIGELKGLVEMGVTELDLNHAVSDRMDNGNAVGLVSGYTTAGGQTHEMADVWFTRARTSPVPQIDELLAAAPTDLVPPAHGTAGIPMPVSDAQTADNVAGMASVGARRRRAGTTTCCACRHRCSDPAHTATALLRRPAPGPPRPSVVGLFPGRAK